MDKLQVFISWSGDRSLAVAKHLKAWLPDVVRNAEPWLSKEDLRKGLQWLPELNKNLGAAGFGLSVLTADNKDAPWLVFEAGVISRALSDKYCCPLLCDLKQTDISGPFASFQSTTITKKEDMLRLVKTMNDASGESKVDEERLMKWFLRAWDDFDKQVNQALAAQSPSSSPAKAGPTDRELLEEVLSTVRRLAIEPRTPMEEMRSRGFEAPLAVPADFVLRDFSRLDPQLQVQLFELLHQPERVDPELWEEIFHIMRRGPRRIRERLIEQPPTPARQEGPRDAPKRDSKKP